MKKIYIKPLIVVEAAMLNTLMETVSVDGEINTGNKGNYTIDAKGTVWDDCEDE